MTDGTVGMTDALLVLRMDLYWVAKMVAKSAEKMDVM